MSTAELIFIGTGTSEGVPRVTCLTAQPQTCSVCADAVLPGSPNRRRNTSVIVRRTVEDGRHLNVLIDPGKFFYHSAIEWFPKFGIRSIDAVILTHSHYDAVGGLDDLRDWTNNAQASITIHAREEDIGVVSKLFYYLVDRSHVTSGGTVAKLQFREIDDSPLDLAGITFTPLPVWHGRPFTAQGYRFGNVAYLPDVSEIPESTVCLIEGAEILVLDALRPGRTHGSHLTVEEAVDVARRLRPGRTLLVGMCHDIDHETMNSQLASLASTEGLRVELAYDGMRLDVKV